MLTDGEGGPLGVVIAGANVVEQKLLKETIEAIVIERPDPDEGNSGVTFAIHRQNEGWRKRTSCAPMGQ